MKHISNILQLVNYVGMYEYVLLLKLFCADVKINAC